MMRFAAWAQTVAASLGGPGLFVVAFFDASFLSLPEINDLLIVLAVTRQKERMLYYVLMATAGSMAGCLALYAMARKGGEAVLARRFSARRLDRAMALVRRYGLLAVLIPSLLPPPAPFKVFVLVAGVARVPLSRFTVAIAIGRGARYLLEGMLAVRYGESTLAYLSEHGATVTWMLLGLVALATVAYLVWRRVVASKSAARSEL